MEEMSMRVTLRPIDRVNILFVFILNNPTLVVKIIISSPAYVGFPYTGLTISVVVTNCVVRTSPERVQHWAHNRNHLEAWSSANTHERDLRSEAVA